jgi:hypothetical protein
MKYLSLILLISLAYVILCVTDANCEASPDPSPYRGGFGREGGGFGGRFGRRGFGGGFGRRGFGGGFGRGFGRGFGGFGGFGRGFGGGFGREGGGFGRGGFGFFG